MKGGRFGFVPAVPVNGEMEILTEEDAKPNVVALFTDGNMKDMRVQTLTPEDRKTFEAEIIWRKEFKNKFPRIAPQRAFREPPLEPIETYDMELHESQTNRRPGSHWQSASGLTTPSS